MTNQPAKRRTSPLIVWPLCLLFLVAIYLASPGPIMWLEAHDRISESTSDMIFDTVYFPISWLGNNTDFFYDHPAGAAYVRYVYWWAE